MNTVRKRRRLTHWPTLAPYFGRNKSGVKEQMTFAFAKLMDVEALVRPVDWQALAALEWERPESASRQSLDSLPRMSVKDAGLTDRQIMILLAIIGNCRENEAYCSLPQSALASPAWTGSQHHV